MSVYPVEMPLVTKKSSRSGVLLPSVGQYVGDPVDRYRQFCSCIAFSNSLPFVGVSREPHLMCLLLCTIYENKKRFFPNSSQSKLFFLVQTVYSVDWSLHCIFLSLNETIFMASWGPVLLNRLICTSLSQWLLFYRMWDTTYRRIHRVGGPRYDEKFLILSSSYVASNLWSRLPWRV
jgi:hypothetical protein